MNRLLDGILGPAHRWKQLLASVLLVGLGSLVLVRGIVPALTRIDTDFPNYYTAARIVVAGGPVQRMYDDAWFQEQTSKEIPGRKTFGRFAPFPPPTALLLVPLAGLDPPSALRVLTAVSLVCLLCCAWLLSRIVPLELTDSGVLALLLAYAVCNNLRFGQPYIEISLACLLGYFAWLKGRPLLAGICFGVFVPIKYFPIVILLAFAVRGQWRVVIGGAAATAAVVLVSIAVLGWPLHSVYLSSVLGNHLVANLGIQDPFTAYFQSFDTLFRRLLIYDPTANPHPWLALPGLQGPAVAVSKTVLAGLAIATLARQVHTDPISSVGSAIGLLGILTLLIAPATASYHFVLLWLPVGLLVGCFLRARAYIHLGLLLGLYTLITFFPYGHAFRFEGDGLLTILAYPRLWVLLAMYLVTTHFLWARARPLERAVEIRAR